MPEHDRKLQKLSDEIAAMQRKIDRLAADQQFWFWLTFILWSASCAMLVKILKTHS